MRNREQIKIIMSDFDFKKVHLAMKALDWKWTYENEKKKVPPVEDLISIAEHCLNNLANSKNRNATLNIGGFEAEKAEGILELRFILEKVNPLSHIFNPDAKNELARKS